MHIQGKSSYKNGKSTCTIPVSLYHDFIMSMGEFLTILDLYTVPAV